jgi:hypothetical protein
LAAGGLGGRRRRRGRRGGRGRARGGREEEEEDPEELALPFIPLPSPSPSLPVVVGEEDEDPEELPLHPNIHTLVFIRRFLVSHRVTRAYERFRWLLFFTIFGSKTSAEWPCGAQS